MSAAYRFDIVDLGNSALAYLMLALFLSPVLAMVGLVSPSMGNEDKVFPSFSGQSLGYAGIALLCLFLGNRVPVWLGWRARSVKWSEAEWRPANALAVYLLTMLAGFATKILTVLQGGELPLPGFLPYGQLSFFLSLNWLSFLALGIAFVQYYRLLRLQNASGVLFWRILAWGTLVFCVMSSFFVVGRFASVLPIILVMIIRHYLIKRSNLQFIVISVAIIAVLFPLKTFWRTQMVSFNELQSGHVETTQSFGQKASSIQVGLLGEKGFFLDSTVGRIRQSHIFTAIVESQRGFEYGRTLLDLPLKVVPPRFWSGLKANIVSDGNRLGRELGIVGDQLTGIGPTLPGDLYLNFGLVGIVVGMFLFGMLYRYLYEALLAKITATGVLLYGVIWIEVVHGLEDWISSSWAVIARLAAIVFMLHLALVFKPSRKMAGR